MNDNTTPEQLPAPRPQGSDDPATASIPVVPTPLSEQPYLQAPSQPEFYAAYAQSGRKSRLVPILSGIIVGLLLLAAGLYVAWYNGYIGGEPEPVTVTVTSSKPADPVMEQPAAATPEPTVQPLPAGAVACGTSAGFNVFAGTSVTSCPFSLNTANAASALGPAGGRVQAYSPVTQRSYTMDCVPVGKDRFDCAGGNNALVHLTR